MAQANASAKWRGIETIANYPMLEFRLTDTDWQDRTNPEGDPYQTARLFSDADTGMATIYVRYPAGSVTPDHTHPCGHGLLVIEGRLLTQTGSFGPGDLVWYSEGSIGHHGATADGPVTTLLFTNRAIAISYQ